MIAVVPRDPDLISVYEAAELAKRHPATIWRWIHLRYLERVKVQLDRRAYVRRSELDELLETIPDD